uniref:PX domain-containing protein n=1 Tax=Odontella aurita TaxID=265563 RepID=A0A7S4NCH1_9STRA
MKEKTDNLAVLLTGENVLGSTESKSFEITIDADADGGTSTNSRTIISISISSFRIVDPMWRAKYAQFLVIYHEGQTKKTVDAWRRFSDFDRLAKKISGSERECCFLGPASVHPSSATGEGANCEDTVESFPDAVKSWKRLKNRMRWHRCYDPGYLGLKAFLLESYLHDILLESSNPRILTDFVAAQAVYPWP